MHLCSHSTWLTKETACSVPVCPDWLPRVITLSHGLSAAVCRHCPSCHTVIGDTCSFQEQKYIFLLLERLKLHNTVSLVSSKVTTFGFQMAACAILFVYLLFCLFLFSHVLGYACILNSYHKSANYMIIESLHDIILP